MWNIYDPAQAISATLEMSEDVKANRAEGDGEQAWRKKERSWEGGREGGKCGERRDIRAKGEENRLARKSDVMPTLASSEIRVFSSQLFNRALV